MRGYSHTTSYWGRRRKNIEVRILCSGAQLHSYMGTLRACQYSRVFCTVKTRRFSGLTQQGKAVVTAKKREGLDIIPCSQANTSARHSSVDARRRPKTSESDTKVLISAVGYALHCPSPTSFGGHEGTGAGACCTVGTKLRTCPFLGDAAQYTSDLCPGGRGYARCPERPTVAAFFPGVRCCLCLPEGFSTQVFC